MTYNLMDKPWCQSIHILVLMFQVLLIYFVNLGGTVDSAMMLHCCQYFLVIPIMVAKKTFIVSYMVFHMTLIV